jgi:hypothetical protein
LSSSVSKSARTMPPSGPSAGQAQRGRASRGRRGKPNHDRRNSRGRGCGWPDRDQGRHRERSSQATFPTRRGGSRGSRGRGGPSRGSARRGRPEVARGFGIDPYRMAAVRGMLDLAQGTGAHDSSRNSRLAPGKSFGRSNRLP